MHKCCLWPMLVSWQKLLIPVESESQAGSILRDEFFSWALSSGKDSILSEERWNRFQKTESGCIQAAAKSFAQQAAACITESIRYSFEHSPGGRDLSMLPERLRTAWRSAKQDHTVYPRMSLGNPGYLFAAEIMKDRDQLTLSAPEQKVIRTGLAEQYRNMTEEEKSRCGPESHDS